METARDPERMQCMEVWGGNVRVEKHFQMPGLEAWISCQPEGRAAAGGDVYYLSSCASGRITRLLLADVSGHGELAARTAEGLRDLMRQNINVVSQRRFVAAMNRQFSAASDDSDFATAIVSFFLCADPVVVAVQRRPSPSTHFPRDPTPVDHTAPVGRSQGFRRQTPRICPWVWTIKPATNS